MKKIGIYALVVLAITIILPTVIVKAFNFVPREEQEIGVVEEYVEPKIQEKKTTVKLGKKVDKLKVYNSHTKKTEEMYLEDYVKGVVAAEMPAEFQIEALKAQAVAARTYAVYRSLKYPEGHPDHPKAPICNGVHCQAYLSLEELEDIHGSSWAEKYWGKIEEAVDSTKDLGIFYDGEIIEPLYHSTSGGWTEDAREVFALSLPYLKSVPSPNEEEAPRFKSITTMTIDDFIGKIKSAYPKVNISEENIHEKIKLIDKTMTGRVKKVSIDGIVVEGRDLRDIFELNSTSFVITLDKELNLIEIETHGYGHGVGMSQWGANSMAKNGSNYEEILKHYYTGVEIRGMN
ncbi:MAG: stage II sporulation protein D [Tissierellaceae bacterium]|nr:stage II sporulation protein D [Tissierellaceae bacterium]